MGWNFFPPGRYNRGMKVVFWLSKTGPRRPSVRSDFGGEQAGSRRPCVGPRRRNGLAAQDFRGTIPLCGGCGTL